MPSGARAQAAPTLDKCFTRQIAFLEEMRLRDRVPGISPIVNQLGNARNKARLLQTTSAKPSSGQRTRHGIATPPSLTTTRIMHQGEPGPEMRPAELHSIRSMTRFVGLANVLGMDTKDTIQQPALDGGLCKKADRPRSQIVLHLETAIPRKETSTEGLPVTTTSG